MMISGPMPAGSPIVIPIRGFVFLAIFLLPFSPRQGCRRTPYASKVFGSGEVVASARDAAVTASLAMVFLPKRNRAQDSAPPRCTAPKVQNYNPHFPATGEAPLAS